MTTPYLDDVVERYARHTGPYPVEALTVVACRCHINIGGPRWDAIATRRLQRAIAELREGAA